jgi:hypothetical protein
LLTFRAHRDVTKVPQGPVVSYLTQQMPTPNGGRNLDPDLVSAYLCEFWGFGNPDGRYWFIGPEQGGSPTRRELEQRLLAWNTRGRRPFEDLHEYHMAIDEDRWTGDDPELQPTWGPLIRTILVADDQEPTYDALLRYQTERLGRVEQETCLLELSPFPSPNQNLRLWSNLGRHLTRRRIRQRRWEPLQELIDQYEPPVIVFYGTTCRHWWECIAPGFCESSVPGIEITTRGSTLCLLLRHPTISSRSLFRRVGEIIRQRASC